MSTRSARRGLAVWGAATAALVLTAAPGSPADLATAVASARSGRYEEALDMLAELEASGAEALSARIERARLLRRVGRYDEAEKSLRAALESAPGGARVELAVLLLERGRWDESQRLLREEVAAAGVDRLEAEVQLGRLAELQGDRPAAEGHFERLIDAYNRGQAVTARDLLAVGDACRNLGYDDPQLFKDALRAYDEALARARDWAEPRIRVGDLFLEKYNGTEARAELEAALAIDPRHPEALLGLARVMHFEGSPGALAQARKSLESNPAFVPAHVFVAQLLLESEDYAAAADEARAALEVDPRALEAKSILAAAHYLEGDLASFERERSEVLALSPRFAELYNLLADACVRNRLYREAVDFARQAIALDPSSWRAWGLRGLNELRLGEMDAGRESLETAFAGDPYNVWIKNTLDLVDTFDEFRDFTSPRFELVAHESEAELLAPYVLDLAEEAYDALAARYRLRPPTPIRLEFYPTHADFSVRTIGLAGMGALGVCFGEVISQDSPRARPRGAFSWASTMWHELAHTFTLTASEHRVPRWLTEGLSVLEERRARPGWGDDVDMGFFAAWKAGELLPVAELNNGFVRPTSPEQIGLSYYQASLVSELVERDWGFDAILGMLHGYRDHLTTEEIFRRVLEIEPEEFDRRFETFLEERFGAVRAAVDDLLPDPQGEESEEPQPAHVPIAVPRERPSEEELADAARERPASFAARLAYGTFLFEQERFDDALPELEAARDLFPQYVGEGSPYRLLAKIHRDRGELAKAAVDLRGLAAVDEAAYDARVELAEVEEELGDSAAAAAALAENIFIDPSDAALHERLAELYGEAGDADGVVRARRALVALHPTDMAKARLELAEALAGAGKIDEARREVLRALEVAPAYEAAQRLLLRLHRGEGEQS